MPSSGPKRDSPHQILCKQCRASLVRQRGTICDTCREEKGELDYARYVWNKER